MKLVLFTKFKVAVDIGFLQYAVDHDKLVVLRLYLSKIYRKMNYLAFVLGEALRQLGDKHAGVDKSTVWATQPVSSCTTGTWPSSSSSSSWASRSSAS